MSGEGWSEVHVQIEQAMRPYVEAARRPLHWLVPAIVGLLAVGAMNAWVMLIEILR